MLRTKRRRERGAVLVEFAIVVPLLMMILFGIVDFGMVLNRDTLVNNAAREGAREASLNPEITAIEGVVHSSLHSLPGGTDRIGVTIQCDGGACPEDIDAGTVVRVTVTYDHDWITFVPRTVGLSGGTTLSKSTEMRVE